MPWLFLSFLLLLGGCASWPPQPATAGADQTLHPVPLAPGVWLVQGLPEAASAANRGFNSNAGIVATEQGTWLFDALGTPELGPRSGRGPKARPICNPWGRRPVCSNGARPCGPGWMKTRGR